MAATIMHFVSNHITYLHYKMQVSPVHKVSSHSVGMDLGLDAEHCTEIGGQQMFNIT